ncbi:MAG: hypothetical protein C4521_12380 [Actinobacteria bacterium]|nr:MAG: hypothetical protein C4521_12380 [Actinomycetota bacterium]
MLAIKKVDAVEWLHNWGSGSMGLRTRLARWVNWLLAMIALGLVWFWGRLKISHYRLSPKLRRLIISMREFWWWLHGWIVAHWPIFVMRLQVIRELVRRHQPETKYVLCRVLGTDGQGKDVLVPKERFGGPYAAVRAATQRMKDGDWGEWAVVRVRKDVVIERVPKAA